MASIAEVGSTKTVPIEDCRIYEAPRRRSSAETDSATFWVSSQLKGAIEVGHCYTLKLDDGTARKAEVRRAVSPGAMPGRTMYFCLLQPPN